VWLIVATPVAKAQDTAAVRIDKIVTIGSRGHDRTQTKSPVPIDVVTAEMLESTGFVETGQSLQRLVPSVNVPHIPLDFRQGVSAQGMSMNGIFRYPGGISPFGLNGRTVYLHVSYR
jgi:hypothetical protein